MAEPNKYWIRDRTSGEQGQSARFYTRGRWVDRAEDAPGVLYPLAQQICRDHAWSMSMGVMIEPVVAHG